MIAIPKKQSDGSYRFNAGMQIDYDGSPRAYGPKGTKPLDYLANAGHPGNWWGIATDEKGNPYIQKEGDPYPGYYVSTTSYIRKKVKLSSPNAYLDSEKIPFIVLPSGWRSKITGIVCGCKATIQRGNKIIEAVVGDFGPNDKIGEASLFVNKFFGNKTGVDKPEFTYTFWPDIPANGFELQPM